MTDSAECDLCREDGGRVLFRHPLLRVVWVDDDEHPAFCRVIAAGHVSEMTDLPPENRSLIMRTVCIVEEVMRHIFQPDKINLASLGNMTPHLHWHIIGRWRADARFPGSIWSPVLRQTDPTLIARCRTMQQQFANAIEVRLRTLES